MHRFIRLASMLVLTLLVSIAVTGCASSQTDPIYSYSTMDDGFDNGAHRPPTAKTLIVMSRILAKRGKDTQCEYVLTRLLRDHSHYMPTYCDMAELHLRHGRVHEAYQVLSDGLALAPDDPILLNDMGMCMIVKGDFQQALTHFRDAARQVPDDARYQANIAVALGLMGRFDEAYAAYEYVLIPAQAHFNLGVLLEACEKYRKATEEYQSAKTLDSTIDIKEHLDRLRPKIQADQS